MSSETLNVLDQTGRGDQHNEAGESALDKPARTIKGKDFSQNSSRANHHHHASGSTKESKKARLGIQHVQDRSRSSSNHNDKSSNSFGVQSNLLSNNHKKLSFMNGDDDDEDEDEDDSEKESHQDHRRLSTEKTTRVEAKFNDNNNDFHTEERISPCATKTKTNCKKAEGVESEHEDEASSTSSCSCEDHSSVADRSEDLHDDLDYDEDSITESPSAPFEDTRLPATEKLTHQSTSSSKKVNNLHTSPTSETNLELEGGESSTPHQANCPPERSSSSAEEEGTSPERKNLNNPKQQHSNRIKSVINFDHINEESSGRISKNSMAEEKVINDKSHKSYDCLLKYFFKDACFFQIKSINHENVELSKSLGVWSTSVQNELRLNTAFREHRNVILIFSVQQSGGFQGFARMVSESRPTSRPVPWVLPERLSNKSLGGVFKVEWLCTKELPFHETHDLYNPFNDNKPVKVARDGQQVESKVGKKLCRLFAHDSRRRLLACVSTLKRQTSQRKKSSQRYDVFYPFQGRRDYPDERHLQNYIPPPGSNGFEGASHPIPIGPPNHTSHISHSPIYSRSLGRRRMLDQSNPAAYYGQGPYPQNCHRPPRPYHLQRNMNGMSRYLMPYSHHDFYQDQAYTPPAGHQYSGAHESWGPNLAMNRYHPYQRSRR